MRLSRSWSIGAALAVLLVGIYFLKEKLTPGKTLYVYSWSAYFPADKVKEFARANGLSVEISYFASNEELFAKMIAGASGYDVILPSDYMVERLVRRGMLRPLDHSLLTGLPNLEPKSFDLPYDPGLKYCVPYTKGNTGLLVNTDKVKVPEGLVSWELLMNSPDPKHTSILDDMREVFAAALLYRGHDPNERDTRVLDEVGLQLRGVKKGITLFTSEPAPLLLKGEVHIAHAFTNHAIQVVAQNPAFKFYFPKEGAVNWTDNLAIPKDATNVAEAHAFINFFLQPENALAATEEHGLGTPNRSAWLLLPAEERENPFLYPTPEEQSRMHFLGDLQGESLQAMNRLWTEMKSY